MFKEYEQIIHGMADIGKKVRDWRSDDNPNKEIINHETLTTIADKKAHFLIQDLILESFPLDHILSEESEIKNLKPKRYWLIDPIDGTASWLEGFDGYVSQICLIENNEILFSVIYAPEFDYLWVGMIGQGAYLNGTKLNNISPVNKVSNFRLVDNYPEPKNIARKVYDALSPEYIQSGSLGLKCAMVASGLADLFIKDVMFRDWDIAPAKLMIQETGAVIVDFKGNEISINDSHEFSNGLIVARDNFLTDRILNLIEEIYEKKGFNCSSSS